MSGREGRRVIVAEGRERDGAEWSGGHTLVNQVLVARKDVVDLRTLGIIFVDDADLLFLAVLVGKRVDCSTGARFLLGSWILRRDDQRLRFGGFGCRLRQNLSPLGIEEVVTTAMLSGIVRQLGGGLVVGRVVGVVEVVVGLLVGGINVLNPATLGSPPLVKLWGFIGVGGPRILGGIEVIPLEGDEGRFPAFLREWSKGSSVFASSSSGVLLAGQVGIGVHLRVVDVRRSVDRVHLVLGLFLGCGGNDHLGMAENGIPGSSVFRAVAVVVLVGGVSSQSDALQCGRGVEEGGVSEGMAVIHWFPRLVDVLHLGYREEIVALA